MQNGREDSVWRALAVAFGDGLAFGVGINLTQNAVRLAAARARPELQPLAERVAAIEQRVDRARANGSLPSPGELDARINELTTRFERQVAEVEVKTKIQVEALHARDRALAKELDGQMTAFREHMIALHREFAETLSRLVEAQIEDGVAARLAPMERHLGEIVREETRRIGEQLAAELEQRLQERDRNVLSLMLTLGQTCLETAERMSPPVAETAAIAE
jgi:hypothetical protein